MSIEHDFPIASGHHHHKRVDLLTNTGALSPSSLLLCKYHRTYFLISTLRVPLQRCCVHQHRTAATAGSFAEWDARPTWLSTFLTLIMIPTASTAIIMPAVQIKLQGHVSCYCQGFFLSTANIQQQYRKHKHSLPCLLVRTLPYFSFDSTHFLRDLLLFHCCLAPEFLCI